MPRMMFENEAAGAVLKEIGAQLRRVRERQRRPASEVAESLGTSKQVISNVENGKTKSLLAYGAYAEALGTTIDDMLETVIERRQGLTIVREAMREAGIVFESDAQATRVANALALVIEDVHDSMVSMAPALVDALNSIAHEVDAA